MKICIMSRGRAGRVETLKHLPLGGPDVHLIVPGNEAEAYRQFYGKTCIVHVQPPRVTNYSQKFQYLLYDYLPEEKKLVIMDDDLYFNRYEVREGERKLCVIKEPQHVAPMFELMERLLDKIPLVGVHPRMMAQKWKDSDTSFEWNSKIVTIQGINRDLIPKGIRVDHFPILADVILSCSLLARGLPNARITTHFVDWLPSQSSGGCDYRTADMQRDATAWIADRFGPYAKQVIKTPKTAKWLGDSRYDLTVRWKDLYNDAPFKDRNPT